MTDATSAVVLTHNIDFLFLQSILRPRLRKCGYPKLTIFADAFCADNSYRQQRHLLDGLGRDYRVVRVDMGAGRRFHPKALFLAGPSKAALAVGSGNLTHGGWSANCEIWTNYKSGEDGLPAIAAFRDYLKTVIELLPTSNQISEETLAAFNSTANTWATNLPEPRGLIGSPDEHPILDRLVEIAGHDVLQIDLCAPYFDPDGEALSTLSRRMAVPVKMWLQRNHVGLSEAAAAALPDNVELISIDTDPSRFVHAKLYSFRRPGSVLFVSGSANLSRAALMADRTWGNAELLTAQELSAEQSEEILSELKLQGTVPELPRTPPSDEWDISTLPLQILTAHYAAGTLAITLRSDTKITRLEIIIEDRERKLLDDYQNNKVVRIHLGKCPRFITLHCTFDTGEKVSSHPMWVDDEESLSISAPERRITAKLAEAVEAGSISPRGMLEIFQLLYLHLQQPVKRTIPIVAEHKKGPTKVGPIYTLEDVFSDSFTQPKGNPSTNLPGHLSEADFLRVFSAYFSTGNMGIDGDEHEMTASYQADDESLNIDDQEKIGNEKTNKEIIKLQAKHKKAEESVRLRNKLISALENVVAAMSAEEFINSRSPERLGADIAATALLLRKGFVDEIISEEDFANITQRLWTVLFFGSKGETGMIEKYLDSCSPDERISFVSAITSPRLSAALLLWCFPNWIDDSTHGIKFRFSAMLLAAKLSWLVCGGTSDEIRVELSRLYRAIPLAIDYKTLDETWTNLVRAGSAFNEFEKVAGVWEAKDLAAMVTRDHVKHGELLWQASEFCVADGNYQREQIARAVVRPLTGANQKTFMGNWLVPVSELLREQNPLAMDDNARCHLLGIVRIWYE